jgi:hypothetical protein
MFIENDAQRLLNSLNETGVQYLLAGKHVSVCHGVSEFPNEQVHIFIENTEANIYRLARTLCHYDPMDLACDRSSKNPFAPLTAPIAVSLDSSDVYFTPHLEGLGFAECHARREFVPPHRVETAIEVPIVGLEDWMRHREAHLKRTLERELGAMRTRQRDRGMQR